jgi:hypothetical protein
MLKAFHQLFKPEPQPIPEDPSKRCQRCGQPLKSYSGFCEDCSVTGWMYFGIHGKSGRGDESRIDGRNRRKA